MAKDFWLGIVITAILVGGFAYYERGPWWQDLFGKHAETAPAPAGAPAAASAPASVAPAPVHHPVPIGTETGTPLPGLDQSDDAIRESLEDVFGKKPVHDFLDPDRIINKLVVTIDNLDRAPPALKDRAVGNVPGQLEVRKSGGGYLLVAANANRYKPYTLALKAADAKMIVAVYRHYYPLFQEAYRALGYPEGEFNDRLIQVIDHLLQAPDLRGSVYLTRPKVLYEFVDEDLEARSSGQKLLLRMGPENEAIVKGKLSEVRSLLAPAHPAPAPKKKAPPSAKMPEPVDESDPPAVAPPPQ